MKIGFFDSGIGGLTVLYEALRMLPDEDYIYYADTKNVPYGTKSKNEVRKYVFSAIDFLVSQNVKAVVIACNTATSVAADDLRDKYNIPIIGIEPAVKPAVKENSNNNKRILVTATALTLKEDKFTNLINKIDSKHKVDLLPLPMLVDFAENLVFDEDIVKAYLVTQFSKFDLTKYGTIVLGCTHFPFYKNIMAKILPPDIDIIDGTLGTVNNLKRTLERRHLLESGNGSITFYKSGKLVTEEIDLYKFRYLLKKLNSPSKEAAAN